MRKIYFFLFLLLVIPIISAYNIYETFPNTLYLHEDNISACNVTNFETIEGYDTYIGSAGTWSICKDMNYHDGSTITIGDYYDESDYQYITNTQSDHIILFMKIDRVIFSNNTFSIGVRHNSTGSSNSRVDVGLYDSSGISGNACFSTDNGNSMKSYFFIGDVINNDQLGLDLNDAGTPNIVYATPGNVANIVEPSGLYYDYIILGFYGNIGYFDWINMTFTNGTNNLPTIEFNVTNEPLCYNETLGYGQILWDMEAIDSEGDTIYYSYHEEAITDIDKQSFSFSHDSDHGEQKDYTFYINSIVESGSCDICLQSTNVTCYSENIFLDPYYYNGELEFWLNLNQDCTGDPIWTYKFDAEYMSLNALWTYFSTKATGNISLEITLLDNAFNTISVLRLNETDTNVTLYHVNSTHEIEIYQYAKSDNMYIQIMELDTTINTLRYLMSGVYSDFYSLYNTNAINRAIKYIRFENLGSVDVWIRELNIEGNTISFDWTTDQYDGYDYDKKENFFLYVYVTDQSHMGNEYNYDYIGVPYRICGSGEYLDTWTRSDSLEDMDAINPYDFLQDFVGSEFRNMLRRLGYMDEAQTLIWWVFIFLMISTMVGIFAVTGMLMFQNALISSSAICLVLSLFVGFAEGQISFLILLTLGMVNAILKVF